MSWSKFMEDNQDYFSENTRYGYYSSVVNGVDINGLVLYGMGSSKQATAYPNDFPQRKRTMPANCK